MDNRIFNVNGSGLEMLRDALSLVFRQEGRNTTCKAWRESQVHGLILLWHTESQYDTSLPVGLGHERTASLADDWLKGDFAKTVELSEWCHDCDHDGHNTKGWQVYCDNWGHVGDSHYAICAVKPAFMWHGK